MNLSEDSEQIKLAEIPYQKMPWRRLLARTLDDIIGIAIVFNIVYYQNQLYKGIYKYNEYSYIDTNSKILVASLFIFVESLLIFMFSTTLGKWIMGLTVKNTDGSKINFEKSLSRSVNIAFWGYALFIPYVSIITRLYSYYILNKEGITTYDYRLNTIVVYKKPRPLGIILRILFILSCVIIHFIVISKISKISLN